MPEVIWLDGITPPPGFTLRDQVCTMISTSLVITIQANISNIHFTTDFSFVPLPPSPSTMPQPIPPIVKTYANCAGHYFISIGTRQQPHSDASSIAPVIINCRLYQVTVLDANGNQINLLIGHILRVLMLLIV